MEQIEPITGQPIPAELLRKLSTQVKNKGSVGTKDRGQPCKQGKASTQQDPVDKDLEPDAVKLTGYREGGKADLMDYLRHAYPSNWQNIMQTIKRRDLWDGFRLSSGMLNTRAIDRFLREIGVLDERNEMAKSLDGWSTKAVYGLDQELDTLDKSMHPPRMKDSYFAECERDDEGHCLPKGEGGNKKPEDKPKKDEEPPKITADEMPKRWGEPLKLRNIEAALKDPEAARQLHDSIDDLKEKTKFEELMAKHGGKIAPPSTPKDDTTPESENAGVLKISEPKTVAFPKQSTAWATKATPEQISTVHRYSGDTFKPINEGLRNFASNDTGLSPEEAAAAALDSLPESVRASAQTIQELIESSKLFTKPVTVYRGTKYSPEVRAQKLAYYESKLKEGSAFTSYGFMSTSLSPGKAVAFSHLTKDEADYDNIIYEIKAKKGLAPNAGSPAYKDEKEIILNHASSFRVVGITKVEINGLPRTLVKMEQIG